MLTYSSQYIHHPRLLLVLPSQKLSLNPVIYIEMNKLLSFFQQIWHILDT